MIDSNQELTTREYKTKTKDELATAAVLDIFEEVGKLKGEDITEENSPFIAGLLVARSLENHFLDVEHFKIDPDLVRNYPPSDRPDFDDLHTKKLLNILTEARSGKFSRLKEFVKQNTEDYRLHSKENSEDKEYKNLIDNVVRNLELISRKIPSQGDGSIIQVPNPAHIEEPVPLKIQLERFERGEKIR